MFRRSRTQKKNIARQKPKAVVLSCSDSRVPPELIFDQSLGDMFVVRVAGNALEASSMASIEYAVLKLGVKLILILGHESCGAIEAALSTPPGKSAGTTDLDHLIQLLRSHMKQGDLEAHDLKDKTLIAPVKHNIDGVAKEFLIRSPVLKKEIEKNRVLIAKAVYHFKTGKVEFWD